MPQPWCGLKNPFFHGLQNSKPKIITLIKSLTKSYSKLRSKCNRKFAKVMFESMCTRHVKPLIKKNEP